MKKDDAARYGEALARGMYLAYWAQCNPNATALIGDQGRLSFKELNMRANRTARALRARGVEAGDSVAVLLHNCFEFVEIVMATRRIGVRLTPLNFHLGGNEAAYIVDDCDAKVFVTSARFADAAAVVRASCPKLQFCIGVAGPAGPIEGFEDYEHTLANQAEHDIEDPVAGLNMLYTSGSTGKPKGVERAASISAPSSALSILAGYVPGESLHLCTGPLYHAAPMSLSLIGPLLFGVGVVLMDGWDAERSLALIEEHGITHTHMVPTMFHRWIALPVSARLKFDVTSLRSVLHGAAPCPVHLKHQLIAWLGPVVNEYYGATEGLGTFVDSETWLKKPGTVGKPASEEQILILDAAGNRLRANEVGTVYLKAPSGAGFRYYKDEQKTLDAFRGEHFTLGDVGYLDSDGYLFLTDRSANLIISGGVNIYPAEVDAVLLTHSAIQDVAVIGVPNAEWGEEVKAVVELRPGFSATDELAQELIAYCRARLAHYKCPRSVDFLDKLPRQDSGKLSKYTLRERYRRKPS